MKDMGDKRMKRLKLKAIATVAAACMVFTMQPAYAAEQSMRIYNSPVVVAGGGPAQGSGSSSSVNAPGGPGGSQAPSGPGSSQAPGDSASPGGSPAAPGGSPVSPGVSSASPGGLAAPGSAPSAPGGSSAPGGYSEAPQSPAHSSGQVPPGDEGTHLSSVITVGGAADAAAQQQAAAEAAAQQQAAAEAAAQQQAAAEAAAQQQAAAEAAAQQQAAEAAAQQSGGRTIDPSKPMVALTFDDGPQPSVGNRIMDCLAQYGGRATFFMVGDRVASRKTEVQRMVREGHEVANHTMNHKYLQKLGAAEIQAQVTKCNDAIEAACGVRPTIMRLPGGNYNSTVVANTHMPMIQWNIDTLDWKTKNADKTVAAVLDHVKDGDIVLMHELYSQSGDAALRIIPELHRRGFQMVTVSEMAAAKGHTLQAGKLYSSFR